MINSVPFRRVFVKGIRCYWAEFAKIDPDKGEINIVVNFKDVDEET